MLEASPFGKRLGFISKVYETWRIFGLSFVARYGIRFLLSKIFSGDVYSFLKSKGIPIISLTKNINSEESLVKIKDMNPDLLVSIAGNEIFKKNLIDLAPNGCLNLHSSLLPLYRGLMPSFWVLKNKEKKSGVSVFYVDDGIDSGPIIIQKKFDILGLSQQELIEKSKSIGMQAIVEALIAIRDSSVTIIENDHNSMTYYSFPTREDVKEFIKAGARFF